jgi:hypothetical protein
MRYLTPLILVRPPIQFKPAQVAVSVRVFRLARSARRPVWSPGYYALQLEAKVRDVVGLYLAPPHNAVVVCVDEKPQIQALERTWPVLPMRPGFPERHTHDYVRHGTTALFAALEAATGTVADACYPRHRHGEFLRFLKKVAAAYPPFSRPASQPIRRTGSPERNGSRLDSRLSNTPPTRGR